MRNKFFHTLVHDVYETALDYWSHQWKGSCVHYTAEAGLFCMKQNSWCFQRLTSPRGIQRTAGVTFEITCNEFLWGRMFFTSSDCLNFRQVTTVAVSSPEFFTSGCIRNVSCNVEKQLLGARSPLWQCHLSEISIPERECIRDFVHKFRIWPKGLNSPQDIGSCTRIQDLAKGLDSPQDNKICRTN